MCHRNLIAGLYLIITSTELQAKVYTPNCPKQINRVEQINKAHNDWEILSDTPNNFLSGISFYSGHPKEEASLKPYSINKKMALWQFSRKEQIYLVCEYHQTGIKLTQPLAIYTTQCIVEYNPHIQSDHGFLPEKIQCITERNE